VDALLVRGQMAPGHGHPAQLTRHLLASVHSRNMVLYLGQREMLSTKIEHKEWFLSKLEH
jgi:hypothetical protein